MSSHENKASDSEASDSLPTRRTAIQLITATLGLLLNVIPAALGGLFFLDPLIRGRKQTAAGADGDLAGCVPLELTSDAIPDDGTPVAATVLADQVDAWNMYRNVPIGSIWLRKNPDGQILAFNTTCPHLGCSVDYRSASNDFFCPCHTSSFDLDGKPKNDVPPRAMDGLRIVRVTNGQPDNAGTELWIEYVDYRGSTSEQIRV